LQKKPLHYYCVPAVIIISLLESLTHFDKLFPDSADYLAIGQNIQRGIFLGDFRLLRPIVPLLAVGLTEFTSLKVAFGLVNVGFWVACTLLFYYFSLHMRLDAFGSFISACFFTCSVPMLQYGAGVLTDTPSYFFILLIICMMFIWNLNDVSIGRLCLFTLLFVIGLLTKETVLSCFFILLCWILVSRRLLWKPLIAIGVSGVLVLLWSHFVSVSYLTLASVQLSYANVNQHFSMLGKAAFWLYSIRVAFTIPVIVLTSIGILALIKPRPSGVILKMHLAMLLGFSGFLLLIVPVVDYRISFIMFPTILTLAAAGTITLSQWLGALTDARFTRFFQLAILFSYAVMTNAMILRIP
jgi:hypothetical protein